MGDIFIRFIGGHPKIRGTSSDSHHRDWIDVLDFSMSVVSPRPEHVPSRAEYLSFGKARDAASNDLWLNVTSRSTPFSSVILDFWDATTKASKLKIELTEASISAVRWAGSRSEAPAKEEIELRFKAAKYHHGRTADDTIFGRADQGTTTEALSLLRDELNDFA